MLVNWKGIKRIFQTYKYKCHKLIQNLEFKYSAPRKYFSKCLAQAKVKCSLVYCCPMKDTLTEKAHSQSYRIPTAGYGMGIHPHLHAQTRALTCKPPTQHREVLLSHIPAQELPGSPEGDSPATFWSGADQHARRHQLQQPRWPCSVPVLCSTAGSCGSYTFQQ